MPEGRCRLAVLMKMLLLGLREEDRKRSVGAALRPATRGRPVDYRASPRLRRSSTPVMVVITLAGGPRARSGTPAAASGKVARSLAQTAGAGADMSYILLPILTIYRLRADEEGR